MAPINPQGVSGPSVNSLLLKDSAVPVIATAPFKRCPGYFNSRSHFIPVPKTQCVQILFSLGKVRIQEPGLGVWRHFSAFCFLLSLSLLPPRWCGLVSGGEGKKSTSSCSFWKPRLSSD